MEQIDDFLTPEEIVRELDKYIIGQEDAKNRLRLPFVIGCDEGCFLKK